MNHFGLYFSAGAVQTARANHKREPFKSALALLDTPGELDVLGTAVVNGLRWRFLDDKTAASAAGDMLRDWQFSAPAITVDSCAELMAVSQVFEMVRETLPDDARRGWLAAYAAHIAALHALAWTPNSLDAIWVGALWIVAGVVLEDDERLRHGVGHLAKIIKDRIHPEGYLMGLVDGGEGGGLVRQVHGVQSLVLGAEAAKHAGVMAEPNVPLWDYGRLGVTVKTAAIYAAAYYEYRKTWHWDTPPTPEEHEAFYRQHAGFFEMLNPHLRPEVLRSTIDKLRPIFDVYGGGITTLTHGIPRRRWLFG